MKLEEYVHQTLLDITNGVSKAQIDAPSWIAPGAIEGQMLLTPQMVSFEVIVTTSKEAGGGITVLSIADAKAKGQHQQVNKISFDVPIYFQSRKIGMDPVE